MGRSPCCDKATVKRGPWSAEEDARLRSYIERHGGDGGSWIALPRKAGLRRCGKSCRLRWLNYLRPDLRHGGWTPEEDRLICALYAAVGSRWSIIAAHLPGRTDNGVKNHWNARLKKKIFAGIMAPPPLQTRGSRRHGGSRYHHDAIVDASTVPLLDPQPWSWSSQPDGTLTGCVGVGHMHHVGAERETDTIAGKEPLCHTKPTDSSCSFGPAYSDLDEIVRSINANGGEHSHLSQSWGADIMEAPDWNQYQQGESVLL